MRSKCLLDRDFLGGENFCGGTIDLTYMYMYIKTLIRQDRSLHN
jgi:hypothetical protein